MILWRPGLSTLDSALILHCPERKQSVMGSMQTQKTTHLRHGESKTTWNASRKPKALQRLDIIISIIVHSLTVTRQTSKTPRPVNAMIKQTFWPLPKLPSSQHPTMPSFKTLIVLTAPYPST